MELRSLIYRLISVVYYHPMHSLLYFRSHLALTTKRCPQIWHLLLPFVRHELGNSQALKSPYRLVAPKPLPGTAVEVDPGITRVSW